LEFGILVDPNNNYHLKQTKFICQNPNKDGLLLWLNSERIFKKYGFSSSISLFSLAENVIAFERIIIKCSEYPAISGTG